jgi:hypothetical protein
MITPRPLTISADDQSKYQGGANPSLSATAVGFAPGDGWNVLSGTLDLTTGAVTLSPIGLYPILVSGQTSRNYAITYVDGVLSVVAPTATVQVSAAIDAALTAYCDPVSDVDVNSFGRCINRRPVDRVSVSALLHVLGAGMRLPPGLLAGISTGTR